MIKLHKQAKKKCYHCEKMFNRGNIKKQEDPLASEIHGDNTKH